jgi:hypothetical protein
LSLSLSPSPALPALSHGSTASVGVRLARPISTGEFVGADVQVCLLPASVWSRRSRATSGLWRPRSRSDGSLTTSATAHKDPASVWSRRSRETSGHSRRPSRSAGSLTTSATAPSSSHHESLSPPPPCSFWGRAHLATHRAGRIGDPKPRDMHPWTTTTNAYKRHFCSKNRAKSTLSCLGIMTYASTGACSKNQEARSKKPLESGGRHDRTVV